MSERIEDVIAEIGGAEKVGGRSNRLWAGQCRAWKDRLTAALERERADVESTEQAAHQLAKWKVGARAALLKLAERIEYDIRTMKDTLAAMPTEPQYARIFYREEIEKAERLAKELRRISEGEK